jgi:hypothetical protein
VTRSTLPLAVEIFDLGADPISEIRFLSPVTEVLESKFMNQLSGWCND